MENEPVLPTTPRQSGPEGLGGWLTLVGLGLFAGPFRNILACLNLYGPIFTQGGWEILTTPGTDLYHPWWRFVIVFELTYNVLFLGASILLAVLFFRRARVFPSVFIAITLSNLFGLFLDAWLVSYVQPNEPMFDPDTAREITRSVFAGVVWIPYMLLSKRVRNTFAR